jgi:hypothetical protein
MNQIYGDKSDGPWLNPPVAGSAILAPNSGGLEVLKLTAAGTQPRRLQDPLVASAQKSRP